jgi:hypothetical protein
MQDPPPTNDGIPERLSARQDVAVLLDVSELEVDKIHLIVRDLRSHASMLPELVSLVNLQIGVDADLDEVELGIKGVRTKVLLKLRLGNACATLVHSLDTVAEHAEILEGPTRTRC